MLLGSCVLIHMNVVMSTHVIFFLTIRRPPRSTRTDTLFPYTTLFRSVDEAVALIAKRAADKGLDLRIELPAAMPTVLRADHGRVRQVLLNYLSNSVKFTARGSVVVQVSAADRKSVG